MESNKRIVFMLASSIDVVLGGAALLIYFGFLPVDLAVWGVSDWMVSLVGGVLFFSGIAIFTYVLTKPETRE